jgi:hypothetical protein
MHGKLGRGGYTAYAIGAHPVWTSIADDDGFRRQLTVTGSASTLRSVWPGERGGDLPGRAPGLPPPATTRPSGPGRPTAAAAPVRRRYGPTAPSRVAPGFPEAPTCASPGSEVSTDSRSCRPPDDHNLGHGDPPQRHANWHANLMITPGFAHAYRHGEFSGADGTGQSARSGCA